MRDKLEPVFGAPLAHLNTFGVKARAAALLDVSSSEQVPAALELARRSLPQPLVVLGAGSNLLFTGDFDGTLLRFSANEVSFSRGEGGQR